MNVASDTGGNFSLSVPDVATSSGVDMVDLCFEVSPDESEKVRHEQELDGSNDAREDADGSKPSYPQEKGTDTETPVLRSGSSKSMLHSVSVPTSLTISVQDENKETVFRSSISSTADSLPELHEHSMVFEGEIRISSMSGALRTTTIRLTAPGDRFVHISLLLARLQERRNVMLRLGESYRRYLQSSFRKVHELQHQLDDVLCETIHDAYDNQASGHRRTASDDVMLPISKTSKEHMIYSGEFDVNRPSTPYLPSQSPFSFLTFLCYFLTDRCSCCRGPFALSHYGIPVHLL